MSSAEEDSRSPLWAPVWEFLQLWLEEAKAERPTRPETLYHYTDVAGLMGILGTQQLWASHAGLLNDESELTLTLGLLNEIIRREPELGDSNPAADTLMINVASNLWYFYDAYIVCFCTEGDLLSQWRGYARPGGYSIGLDPNTFPHTTLTNLDLIPVRYDANAHVERVRELVKRWRVAFRFGYDTASDIARRLGLVFATALTRTAVTFKHPAFHEEREWRLALPRLQVETEAGPGHSVRYRARDGLILPYLPIDLVPGPEGNSPARLREIVVGPNREPVLANLALKRYLLHLGYPAASFPVTTSAAPLRT